MTTPLVEYIYSSSWPDDGDLSPKHVAPLIPYIFELFDEVYVSMGYAIDPEALQIEVDKGRIERRLFLDVPELQYVWRKEWRPRKPEYVIPLKLPAETVFLTYTGTEPCKDDNTCVKVIQDLQKTHIAEGCSDIHWNFLVGGNGKVYEGRGWNVSPQKMPDFEDLDRKSLDIAYIARSKGDITYRMRSAKTLLIKLGVLEWFIDEEYNLVEAGAENVQRQIGIALGKIKKEKTDEDVNRPRLQISSAFVKRLIDEATGEKVEEELNAEESKGKEDDDKTMQDTAPKLNKKPKQQSKKPKKLSKKMKAMYEKLKAVGATIECDSDMECLNPNSNKRSKLIPDDSSDEGEEPKKKRYRNKELRKRLKYERILKERLDMMK